MIGGLRSFALVAALVILPVAAPAVQPDEVLPDPALESRAREISDGLRCLVCRNENIDESNAGLARDMRLLVRERVMEGDSNEEVVDFIVDRYGEYVLLNPTVRGSNLILWLAGPAMFVLALGIGWVYLRSRQTSDADAAPDLSQDEADRLKKILGE
jgi:cytochrome c-type biogenesis protein CcmH